MQTIPITSASDDQLRACATLILGIDEDAVRNAADRPSLMALISPARPQTWEEGTIRIPDAPPPLAQTGQLESITPTADVTLFSHLTEDFGPMTRFTIISTNMPGGNHPASPIVNGRLLVMQRNMRIEAPYAFYLALRNANIGAPYEIDNGQGKPPGIGYADVTNYPLSDVIEPPKDEIAAWHAKNGKRLLGEPQSIAA